MHDLLKLLHSRIGTGLLRQSITSPSAWAEKYRIMGAPFPGPWSFKHHPWSREIHDSKAELIVGQKAAQVAFTETALNKAFCAIDLFGQSVLYILPSTTPDASDFSTSRFDPALELSPHLTNLFSDVKNIGHKRAGSANLFIRGSRSRAQLKSLPVSMIIMDEIDEFTQENIPLAFERMSGQTERQVFMLSTPTIEGRGINAYYKNSTQKHFFFRCPHCSKLTELTYPECLVIPTDDPNSDLVYQSHLICKECHHILDHQDKPNFLSTGQWVATFPDRAADGYTISQLYSCVLPPYFVAQSYLRSLTNPADEQEFYNSKLGIPHTVAGSNVTEEDYTASIADYAMLTQFNSSGSCVTVGIDVGSNLHYVVVQWLFKAMDYSDPNISAEARVLAVGKTESFEAMDQIFARYGAHFAVIDHQPETRMAESLAGRHPGRVKLCHYGNNVSGRRITKSDEKSFITVDRTTWLDTCLSRFRNRTIHIPKDSPQEFKSQVMAPVRTYKNDKDGNPIARYDSGTNADHFAHALNYAEIALPLALGTGQTIDARGVL